VPACPANPWLRRGNTDSTGRIRANGIGRDTTFTQGHAAIDAAHLATYDRSGPRSGPARTSRRRQAATPGSRPGKGLRGDRHFCADGAKPGQALTLIEAGALQDAGLTGAQSRRQVVVRAVRLNDLAGRRFRVGDVECAGAELREPCLHLQQLTRPEIITDLIHRGGLNAGILTDGQIRVGDRVSTG